MLASPGASIHDRLSAEGVRLPLPNSGDESLFVRDPQIVIAMRLRKRLVPFVFREAAGSVEVAT